MFRRHTRNERYSASTPQPTGGLSLQRHDLNPGWICRFEGASGANARAVFASREEAVRFAERHALFVAQSGVPLKWEDVGEQSLLRAGIGDYVVSASPPAGS